MVSVIAKLSLIFIFEAERKKKKKQHVFNKNGKIDK